MAKLLHIQTSPRGSRSASQALAEHFIDSYRNTHRGDTVETLNVWQAQFPELDGAIIEAKYAIAHGQPHSPEQVHAWKAVARLADHFKLADKYIVSLPMWNFGIPYKLKHYIDLLVQPGLTFGFTQGGRLQGTGYRQTAPGNLCARRRIWSRLRRRSRRPTEHLSETNPGLHRVRKYPGDFR
jgi:FMN-dependent NADH-azoreductase